MQYIITMRALCQVFEKRPLNWRMGEFIMQIQYIGIKTSAAQDRIGNPGGWGLA
jgi:hypothetical protein